MCITEQKWEPLTENQLQWAILIHTAADDAPSDPSGSIVRYTCICTIKKNCIYFLLYSAATVYQKMLTILFFFFSYPASVHVSYCGTPCSFQIERGFLYCLLHWFFGGVWNFIWHAKCFRFLVVYGQNIFRLTLQKWEARSFMGGVYVAVAVSTSVYGLCLCVPGLINKEMLGGKLCWMNKTTSLYCWSDIYNHLQWWQLIKCKESVICCPFVDAS